MNLPPLNAPHPPGAVKVVRSYANQGSLVGRVLVRLGVLKQRWTVTYEFVDKGEQGK